MSDQGETPQDGAARRRPRSTIADLVRSLGVVGIGVVVLMAITLRNEPQHPPVTVDVKATVAAARASVDFPVLAATTLPYGIYANTARFEPSADGHWTYYVGYTDGFSGYLSVEASSATGADALAAPFPGAQAAALRTIDGIGFEVYAESEVEVWFHAPSPDAPYAMQVACNSLDTCADIRAALSTDGAVAVGEPATAW